MKRTVAGFALLILLLAGGLLSGWSQSRYHDRVTELLEQAGRLALAEEMAAAVETAADAREIWQRGWMLAAVLTDHDPLELVDVGFRRLEVYASVGDRVSFATLCAELAGQVRALGDAHGAQWWNFL